MEATLFFAGVEAWKWGKRVYFRKQMKYNGGHLEDSENGAFAAYFDQAD